MTRLRYLAALLLLLAAVSGVEGATLVVAPEGGDYIALQPAVDAALPGDTIEVRQGSYPGNVQITTPVTIRGVEGVTLGTGEDSAGLIIGADGVVVRTITIEGQNAGIIFNESSGSVAEGCRITAGDTAVLLSGCSGCSVLNSTIQAGERGVDVNSSGDTLLSGLGIAGGEIGIYLRLSEGAAIQQSSLSGCKIGTVADECENVTLDGTSFSSVGAGFLCMGTEGARISDSSFDEVVQYLQFFTASGCRVETETLQGPEYFAADVFSDTSYACGPWTVTGWNFALLHQPYSAPTGYTLLGEAMNITFIPEAESSYDAGVLMSARLEGSDEEEAGLYGFYRIDKGATVLISETTNESGTFLVEAMTVAPGHFALMKRPKPGEDMMVVCIIVMLAVIGVLGYLVVRKKWKTK